jgi:hypothetical protein
LSFGALFKSSPTINNHVCQNYGLTENTSEKTLGSTIKNSYNKFKLEATGNASKKHKDPDLLQTKAIQA